MDAAGASPLLCRRTLSAGAPSFPPSPFHRRTPSAKLGFRRRPPEPKAATSSNEPQVRLAPVSIVSPVYSTTHRDRELRTPHSGYHFDGTARAFFEGWYFRVSIPHCRQSFCFMYSVENPAFPEGMGMLERLTHGHRFTGVGAQILGADDKYICQYTEQSKNFWGSKYELMLGNTFIAGHNLAPPNRELDPQEFRKRVLEGFQVTPFWHQGFIRDDGRSNHVRTVNSAHWEYSTRPVYGWGDVKSKQKSTAGWLAAFPVFEPHWQICMAGGLSTASRHGADLLSEAITATTGLKSLSIHGEKGISERREALRLFLTGEVSILVSTGILGRGIDLLKSSAGACSEFKI